MNTFWHFSAASSRTFLVRSSSLWSILWIFHSFVWHSLLQYFAFLQPTQVFSSDSEAGSWNNKVKTFEIASVLGTSLWSLLYLSTLPTSFHPFGFEVFWLDSELFLQKVPHEDVIHLHAGVQVHNLECEYDELLDVVIVAVLLINSGRDQQKKKEKSTKVINLKEDQDKKLTGELRNYYLNQTRR